MGTRASWEGPLCGSLMPWLLPGVSSNRSSGGHRAGQRWGRGRAGPSSRLRTPQGEAPTEQPVQSLLREEGTRAEEPGRRRRGQGHSAASALEPDIWKELAWGSQALGTGLLPAPALAPGVSRGEPEEEENDSAERKRNVFLKSTRMEGIEARSPAPGWGPNAFSAEVGRVCKQPERPLGFPDQE